MRHTTNGTVVPIVLRLLGKPQLRRAAPRCLPFQLITIDALTNGYSVNGGQLMVQWPQKLYFDWKMHLKHERLTLVLMLMGLDFCPKDGGVQTGSKMFKDNLRMPKAGDWTELYPSWSLQTSSPCGEWPLDKGLTKEFVPQRTAWVARQESSVWCMAY